MLLFLFARHSFEYSLVQELRYNGFHRMRQGFDRALQKEGGDEIYNNKMFPVVLDAGCGTGLAGEVVSLKLSFNLTFAVDFHSLMTRYYHHAVSKYKSNFDRGRS